MGNENDAVDPVRNDPANTQDSADDQKIADATSAADLEGVEIPEVPKPPKAPLQANIVTHTLSASAVAGDPDSEAKLRELASQAATDKDHPLHALGAGLPFGPAVINILSVIYQVLNMLHQGGLIEPAKAEAEEKPAK